jgi:uncharacterized protein YcbK (DUF882 family)
VTLLSEPLFFRHEFACRCGCGFDTIDAELLRILLQTRNHFKAPVKITSGCRCQAYNATLPDSSPTSKHTQGRAADIRVQNHSPAQVYTYLIQRYPGRYGIGKYNTFTHLDTRSGPPKRW